MARWRDTGTSQQSPIKASSVSYFYGRITRDEAEEILKERGSEEGMFLLRESISPLGNYAISLCHDNKVHHYSIEKQTDGTYMIPAGKKFMGPVELIMHHQSTQDGVITLLRCNCERQGAQAPIAFRGMTYSDLEQELIQKANSMKSVKKDRAFGAQREHLVLMVAKDLHVKQPWYHGRIDRGESEKRLKTSGHKDGKFLVRVREDKKTFAICISFKQDTRHYLIDRDENKKFGIQDGPKFDCIMMLVDHYHNKQDGLLCKLTEPCPKPGFDENMLQKYIEINMNNIEYFRLPSAPPAYPPQGATAVPGRPPSVRQPSDIAPPIPAVGKRPSLRDVLRTDGRTPDNKRTLPPPPEPPTDRWFAGGDWEGDQMKSSRRGGAGASGSLRGLNMQAEELEDIYGCVPRTLNHFDLQRHQLDLQDELGAGQFGSVRRGMCRLQDGRNIPVAVKTLKQEDWNPALEPELIKEAKVMMPLSHKHIVRMIGVCRAESIMLVLELAPLGQLNSYLQEHREMSQANIVELMWQVAKGMEFLESKKFVHRDLAARNVLLVTEHFAKISDFGMSKALGRDNNYYEAKEAGKWPLKWYAPECVYYWKFDSKSDVWSYGVTLWEATSYGEKPYKKMKGQQILKFLVDDELRLEKPDRCEEDVYTVMLRCWQYLKEDRPMFSEIVAYMGSIYDRMKMMSYR